MNCTTKKSRFFSTSVNFMQTHFNFFYLSNSLSCNRLHRNGPIDTGRPQKKVKKSHTHKYSNETRTSAYSNLTCINFQWWYLCVGSSLTRCSPAVLKTKKRIQCLNSNVHVEMDICDLKALLHVYKKKIESERDSLSKNCIQSSQNEKRFMAIFLRIKAFVCSKHWND